jgi:hypothetical protein
MAALDVDARATPPFMVMAKGWAPPILTDAGGERDGGERAAEATAPISAKHS